MSAAPEIRQTFKEPWSPRDLFSILFSFAKWASIGSGVMVGSFALADPASSTTWAGLACFLALLARFLQSEESQAGKDFRSQ